MDSMLCYAVRSSSRVFRGLREEVRKVAKPKRWRSRFRNYWQAISDKSAVRWTVHAQDDGEEFIAGPTALIVLGSVRFDDLRSIRLSTMQPHRAGFPEFDQDDPPTKRQLEAAWKRSAAARTKGDAKANEPLPFTKRAKGESLDRFYRRVAQFYRVSVLATGTPARDMAEAAGVPVSTSKWWIREARARGYLPPPAKGQGIA